MMENTDGKGETVNRRDGGFDEGMGGESVGSGGRQKIAGAA